MYTRRMGRIKSLQCSRNLRAGFAHAVREATIANIRRSFASDSARQSSLHRTLGFRVPDERRKVHFQRRTCPIRGYKGVEKNRAQPHDEPRPRLSLNLILQQNHEMSAKQARANTFEGKVQKMFAQFSIRGPLATSSRCINALACSRSLSKSASSFSRVHSPWCPGPPLGLTNILPRISLCVISKNERLLLKIEHILHSVHPYLATVSPLPRTPSPVYDTGRQSELVCLNQQNKQSESTNINLQANARTSPKTKGVARSLSA
jgi:hypothetical protein